MLSAVEELDRVAELCTRLDLGVLESDLARRVLEPIAGLVGAETAALRCFGLANGEPTQQASQFGALERARARIVAGYLHAKAGRPRADTVSNRGHSPELALTGREKEVADAVAIGISNKQVAESLGISVRTVENHLRSIFAKCNVASRTALAAKLRGSRLRVDKHAKRGTP